MSARIIPLPARGPFAVRVEREQKGAPFWLVLCRDHGWAHADHREAIEEASALARAFGVAVMVAS